MRLKRTIEERRDEGKLERNHHQITSTHVYCSKFILYFYLIYFNSILNNIYYNLNYTI